MKKSEKNGKGVTVERPKTLGITKKYTRFETARILGARALQISMGAPIMVLCSSDDNFDPLEIAMHEMEKGLIPITVKRRIVATGDGESD